MTLDTGWFKSSFSGTANNDCLEVRLSPVTVHVRDSKDPSAGSLSFPPRHWTRFLADSADWRRTTPSC
jgi:hypothetical protein